MREQIPGPDLHVLTLNSLALKNWFFPHENYILIFFDFCLPLFYATFQYFQKNFELIFVHKNFKRRASKVAHNRPRPFFPRPQPTAQN